MTPMPCAKRLLPKGAVAVIRPRKNRVEDRPYDKEVYKRRNVIERFFHRLKQYRRVATRYDKYARRYLGFVHFATLLITAKKNVNTTLSYCYQYEGICQCSDGCLAHAVQDFLVLTRLVYGNHRVRGADTRVYPRYALGAPPL